MALYPKDLWVTLGQGPTIPSSTTPAASILERTQETFDPATSGQRLRKSTPTKRCLTLLTEASRGEGGMGFRKDRLGDGSPTNQHQAKGSHRPGLHQALTQGRPKPPSKPSQGSMSPA